VVKLKKIISIAAMLTLLLGAPAAAQDRPGGPQNRDTSADIGKPPTNRLGPLGRSPSIANATMKTLQTGIGICLIGDKYGYIDEIADADKCDAVMWANTITWAKNQRKLIDQSTLAGDSSTTTDGETICHSCSGTCQTVSLPIKDSKYDDVESDDGQSPSERLSSIRAICEAAPYRHLASARCGN
jgi:hypothetical protein